MKIFFTYLSLIATAYGAVSCTIGSTCTATSEVCPSGTCVDCQTVSDCARSGACQDNMCFECITNSECPSPNFCANGTCISCSSQTCWGSEICVAGYGCAQCNGVSDVCPPYQIIDLDPPDITVLQACLNTYFCQCGVVDLCSTDYGTNCTINKCGFCNSNSECGPALPFCNTNIQRCQTSCIPTNCPSGQHCDLTGDHLCHSCIIDDHCSGTDVCYNFTCVSCRGNAECSNPYPICSGHNCIGCSAGTCSGGLTCVGGACVCTKNSECTDPTYPICHNQQCVDCSSITCSGGTYCRPTDGVCVQCLSNTECSNPTPVCVSNVCESCNYGGCTSPLVCDSSTGSCVQCLTNGNCGGSTPFCHTSSNACGLCTDNTECQSKFPSTPYCDPSNNACVGCLKNSECTSPSASYCNSYACTACIQSDCTPNSEYCDSGTGKCVNCLINSECGNPAPNCYLTNCVPCSTGGTCTSPNVCNHADGDCVQCIGNGECSGGTPVCFTGGDYCVQCLVDTDCHGSAPYCDPSHVCVQCLGDVNCTDIYTPVCDSSYSCTACKTNSECSPIYCKNTTGACVNCIINLECPNGEICLNNNCQNCTGPGQCTSPYVFCDTTFHRCVQCLYQSECVSPDVCLEHLCYPQNTCFQQNECPSLGFPYCDIPKQTCVQCLSSLNCTNPSSGYCNPTSNSCNPCTGAGQCGPGLICNNNTGICGNCITNAECSNPEPTCKSSYCISCSINSDCTSPQLCAPNGECHECVTDLQCSNPLKPICLNFNCSGCTSATCPGGTYCSPNGNCVQCLKNSNCISSLTAPYCNSTYLCAPCTQYPAMCGSQICSTTGQCVQCLTNAECNPTSTAPICRNNICSNCITNDCPAGSFCNTHTGACVQCIVNSECPLSSPACVNYICGPCTNNNECSGLVCGSSGTCVQCHQNSDCTAASTKPICVTNVCSPCSAGACPNNLLCSSSGKCQSCLNNNECKITSTAPICGSVGACVACQTGQCPNNLECNTQTGTCVQCLTNSECTQNTTLPLCVSNICSPCNNGTCPNGLLCNQNSGACVECITSSDCLEVNQECTSNFTCISCGTGCLLVATAAAQSVAAASSAAATTAVAASAANLVVGANPSLFLGQLGVIQALMLMLFFNINYPSNLQNFISIFKIGMMKFMPNPFSWFKPTVPNFENVIPQKFTDNEFTGVFLLDVGNILFLMLILAFIDLICRLVEKFTTSAGQYFEKARLLVGIPFAFQLFMQTGIIILIAILVQLRFCWSPDGIVLTSGFFGLIILAGFILSMMATFLVYRKLKAAIVDQKSTYKHLMKQYGFFFQGFVAKGKLPQPFLAVIIFKNLCQIGAVVLLTAHPQAQVMSQFVITIAYSIGLSILKPYVEKSTQNVNMVTEYLLAIIYLLLSILSTESSADVRKNEENTPLGWAIIAISAVIIIIFLGRSFIETYQNIKKICSKKKPNSVDTKKKGRKIITNLEKTTTLTNLENENSNKTGETKPQKLMKPLKITRSKFDRMVPGVRKN